MAITIPNAQNAKLMRTPRIRPFRRGGGGPFDPITLGIPYYEMDLRTIWADDARSVPAAVNDPVAVWEGKGVSGYDWVQTDPALRPILREADGILFIEMNGEQWFNNEAGGFGQVPAITFGVRVWFGPTYIANQGIWGGNNLSTRRLEVNFNGTPTAYEFAVQQGSAPLDGPLPTPVLGGPEAFVIGWPDNVTVPRAGSFASDSGAQTFTNLAGTAGGNVNTLGRSSRTPTIMNVSACAFGPTTYLNASQRSNLKAWLESKPITAIPFTPDILFKASDEGAWFDFTDRSTQFQTPGGAPVTADGQPVQQVLDLSGNGHDLSEITDNPVASTFSGLNAVSFDGVADKLLTEVIPMRASSACLMVCRPTALGGAISLRTGVDMGNGYNQLLRFSSTQPQSLVFNDGGGTTTVTGPALSVGSLSVILCNLPSEGLGLIRVNGLLGVGVPLPVLRVGSNALGLGLATNGAFEGDILEVLVIDRALTDPEVALVEQYLFNKYPDLIVQLPVIGPFELPGNPPFYLRKVEPDWEVGYSIDADPEPEVWINLRQALQDANIDINLRNFVRQKAIDNGWIE